jgi:hypothetical protein
VRGSLKELSSERGMTMKRKRRTPPLIMIYCME